MSKLITPALTNDDAGPLTVADLITLLHQYPQDLAVLVSGYEGGYQEIRDIRQQTLLLNVNDSASYSGPHDSIGSVCDPEEYQKQDFLIIARSKYR